MYNVAFVAQKGGVGKSTLARLLAVEAAKGGLEVKIADLDTRQTTSVNWTARRAENGLMPEIRAEAFGNIETAIRESNTFDLYIFDGAAYSSGDTLKVCMASDLIVIPTSEGIDDLHPSVILANNLLKEGIDAQRIAFVLTITSDSEREIASAREYLAQTPYLVLAGHIPFRTGFKVALDQGKSITETRFVTLRKRAGAVAQNIIDAVAAIDEQHRSTQQKESA